MAGVIPEYLRQRCDGAAELAYCREHHIKTYGKTVPFDPYNPTHYIADRWNKESLKKALAAFGPKEDITLHKALQMAVDNNVDLQAHKIAPVELTWLEML